MEKLLGAFCFIFAARVEGRVYPPATADRAEGEIGPTGPPGKSGRSARRGNRTDGLGRRVASVCGEMGFEKGARLRRLTADG